MPRICLEKYKVEQRFCKSDQKVVMENEKTNILVPDIGHCIDGFQS